MKINWMLTSLPIAKLGKGHTVGELVILLVIKWENFDEKDELMEVLKYWMLIMKVFKNITVP